MSHLGGWSPGELAQSSRCAAVSACRAFFKSASPLVRKIACSSPKKRSAAQAVWNLRQVAAFAQRCLCQRPRGTKRPMKSTLHILAFTLAMTSAVSAQPVRWTSYNIPETGTSVDFPSSIFTEEAGRPDGYGRTFRSADGQASLTIQAAPNVSNDSPAAFLAKRHPPPQIQYKRVTARFFAVSSYKDDKVWYDRCNFTGKLVHCVLLKYPAREEHAWDQIVTRISLSLNGN
jgi:hypothetical protein